MFIAITNDTLKDLFNSRTISTTDPLALSGSNNAGDKVSYIAFGASLKELAKSIRDDIELFRQQYAEEEPCTDNSWEWVFDIYDTDNPKNIRRDVFTLSYRYCTNSTLDEILNQ